MPVPSSSSAISPESGIVYAATMKDHYVEEAFLSAETVKQRYPSLPITLFTDRPDHVLCRLGNFERVEQAQLPSNLDAPSAQAQIARLRCLLASPYERTLHLDTDTRVLTEELPQLFTRLEQLDVAMVETSVDDSFSRRHFGRRMFNSGLVLFRRTTKTREWLEAWFSLSERNFNIASQPVLRDVAFLQHIPREDVRRRLLFMDQVSLVEILTPEVNPFGLDVCILDPSWNHRGSSLPMNNRLPAKIIHFPELRKLVHADILSVAFAWKREGRSEAAEDLYRYIASRYPGTGSSDDEVLQGRAPSRTLFASMKPSASTTAPRTADPVRGKNSCGDLQGPEQKEEVSGWPRFERFVSRFVANGDDQKMTWYPGLTARRWHDPSSFPAVGILESEFPRIKAEYLSLRGEAGFQPEMEPLRRKGQWNVFMLYELGKKNAENCAKCPETTRIVESLPAIRTMVGLTYFSNLLPGAHILPHSGPTNMRLRCHLALNVPERCGIRVGGEERTWAVGKCLVFDDSFQHEAWNDSNELRTVLVIDLWHPDLTGIEIEALKGLQKYVQSQAGELTDYWQRNERGRTLMPRQERWR
jgi:hypothetical protein